MRRRSLPLDARVRLLSSAPPLGALHTPPRPGPSPGCAIAPQLSSRRVCCAPEGCASRSLALAGHDAEFRGARCVGCPPPDARTSRELRRGGEGQRGDRARYGGGEEIRGGSTQGEEGLRSELDMWGREVRGRAARAWPSEGRRPAAARAVGEAEAELRKSRVGRAWWKRIVFSSPRHGAVGRGRDGGVVGWARRGYRRAGKERWGKKTLRFWQKRSPNYVSYGRSNFLIITQPDE
jgi:hypothetical protein